MSDEINELPLKIEVEDVSNEDVDIVEDAQEYEVQESDTVYIQTSEEDSIVIEVEETMGWAGGDSGAHSSLYGRDYPDQHPISAITGLSEKLSDIEALKSVQSNKFGIANYYKWANNERRGEYGYFVSFIPQSETIAICNGGDIFGVTVQFAGFIGGQDKVKRGNDYALVATSGVVTVRCESNVNINDYVVSNAYGIATKTTSGCGYKVITVDASHDVYYASISLGVQACTTDILGKNLQTLDTRISDAETNIAAAMNTANAAYKKAAESISSNESMKDQIDDALGKVDDMETDIKNIGDQVSDISTISAEAKAIADTAATFAKSARNEAVVTANEALSKAGEIEATVEPISNWEYTDPVTGETNTGATYFAEYVKNGLSTKAEMETVSRLDEENKLLIEKNAESYLQMLSSVDKYSVGEYSQAYGLTAEQAKNILKVGMIYIPTVDHIEPLFANGEREVFRNALYVWGGESWGGETLNIVWLGSNNPGSSYKYWYTELDEAEEGYEPHTLYINNDGEWVEVATLAGNVNNRITSMIRQDVNSITMEVVNTIGSFASINARVSENETNISNIAAWVEQGGSNISAIEQSADENGATMALVVAHNEEAKTLSGASIVLGTGDNPSYISLSADAINLEGVVTANGTFQINTDGSMITTGGIIGGFEINDNAIYSVADTSQINPPYSWAKIYMDSYNSITPQTSLWNNYFYDADNNQINRNYVYVGTDGIGTCRIKDYDEEWVCQGGELSDANLVRAYMANGKLYAEDAEITGGTIGGFEICDTFIRSIQRVDYGDGYVKTTGMNTSLSLDLGTFLGSELDDKEFVYLGFDGFGSIHTIYDADADSVCVDYQVNISKGRATCWTVGALTNPSMCTLNGVGITFVNDMGLTELSRLFVGVDEIPSIDNVCVYKITTEDYLDITTGAIGTLGGTWQSDSAIGITSWRGAKHDIEPLTDKYSILFDNLHPVRFKYNNGKSNRYHTGLVLDELKNAMDIAGIDSTEFAAYCINDTETGNGGIRYGELIALLIAEVQKLKERVALLEG